MTNTRTIGVFAAVVLGGTLLVACGSSEPPGRVTGGSAKVTLVRLEVGGLSKQIYLPVELAALLGFFRQQNLDVELADEPTGVIGETTLLAGKIDGIVGFYDHTLDLQAEGKSVESVVQLLQSPGEVELCRSSLQRAIVSPSDWPGRRIGVTDLGSSTDFITKYLAVRHGVAVNGFHEVVVHAVSNFVSALRHKRIDCGMTTEPTVSAVLERNVGYAIVDTRTLAGTRQALGGPYPASALWMTTSYVDSHHDVVQRLANALVQTMHWINRHNVEQIAAELPASYFASIGRAAYVRALEREKGIYTPDGLMPAGGPRTVLNVLSAFDPKVKAGLIDLSKTYTTAFARKANQAYPLG